MDRKELLEQVLREQLVHRALTVFKVRKDLEYKELLVRKELEYKAHLVHKALMAYKVYKAY